MAERVLGLDVGTSAVRVVEVVLSSPPTVSRVGEVPLPLGAVRDGEVIDAAAVGAAITELWRQTGLRSRDVRVGLTGSRVVVRVIEMPAMPDDEMAGAVRFSASDHIPIPIDEAVLDHAVLEPIAPAEPGGPPQVKVLLVAAYRSTLDALLAAVNAGGLRAVGIDLVPFALVRALADRRAPEVGAVDDPSGPPVADAEAIVSVGAGLTTVIVHEGGVPRFVRTVAAGGDLLTAAISDELGVTPEAAEEAKRAIGDEHGHGADDFVRRAARVVELRLAGILSEIQSSLAYWMAQAERPLSRVVLTGGGVRAGDVAGRLALLVGVRVEPGTAQGLEAPERALGTGEWPDLTVAAGLALGASASGGWAIDLCPPQKRKLRLDRRLMMRIGVAAAVVLVILGGLSTRSVLAVRQARQQLAAADKVNRGIQAEIDRYNSFQRLNGDLETSRRRVQSALSGDVSWTRFLSDFVQNMPGSVWISTLSAQTTPAGKTAAAPTAAGSKPATPGSSGIGSLQWSVTGLDYPAAAAWLTQLAQDPDLSGVSIGGVTETQPGGRPTVAFTSSATLAPQARSDRGSRLTKGGQ